MSSRTVPRSGNIAGTVLFNQVGITLKDATRPMMENNASAEIYKVRSKISETELKYKRQERCPDKFEFIHLK